MSWDSGTINNQIRIHMTQYIITLSYKNLKELKTGLTDSHYYIVAYQKDTSIVSPTQDILYCENPFKI